MCPIQTDDPEWILPFEALEIGQSFFIPTLKTAKMLFVIEKRARIARVKVKCFTSVKDGHMGVRVWRIRD
jgi:hypothetical protein